MGIFGTKKPGEIGTGRAPAPEYLENG